MSKSKKDWEKINEAFAAVVELNAEQQASFLRKMPDENLRREVEAILSASNQAAAQDFLGADAFAAGARILAEENETATMKQIGQYKILREIGRGGMGAVYLASRADFRQKVALKIIKRGMDTDEIIRRFEREREVLAALDHPNIARLLDGGTTADGLPFLVMEYVEGLPIGKYCDENSLNVEERLKLFRKTCAAVQFAHQNLIVHRDLKPSNILVTKDGEPKLLDFGIAKLLTPDATNQTTETEFRMLTPEYASPEQIRGERVTTASDVYSLGVLLYELLTAQKPYEITSRNAAEIIRAVCETEPPAPSNAWQDTVTRKRGDTEKNKPLEQKITASPRRHVTASQLKGDLDNIILKALRKEIAERYTSVEQFAEDIRRFLIGLPVVARRATLGYQFTKFVGRNRTAVVFSSLALIALFAGLSIALWQANVARRERMRAERQSAETRRLANGLLNEYDEEILNLPGSYPVRVKLAQASSEYLDRLAQESDDPAIYRELIKARSHLGDLYGYHLGDRTEAKRHYAIALEFARRVFELAPDDPAAKELMAETLLLDFSDRSIVEENFREAIRLREEIVAAAPSNLQALGNLASSYRGLGIEFGNTQRQEESQNYFRRAVEIREKQIALLDKNELTADEYSTKYEAFVWNGLAQRDDLDDLQTAVVTLKKALEISETAAAKFPDNQRIQINLHQAHSYLARAFDKTGDYESALRHYELALETNKATAQRFNLFWHAYQARYFLKIAEMLQKTGRTDAALEKARQSLNVRREATAVNYADPRNQDSHANLFIEAGIFFAAAGKPVEALAAYREAEEKWQLLAKIQQNKSDGILGVARANMYIGDLAALCPTTAASPTQKNRTKLLEALKRYEKSVQIYTENRAILNTEHRKDAELAEAKFAACKLKLNGRL